MADDQKIRSLRTHPRLTAKAMDQGGWNLLTRMTGRKSYSPAPRSIMVDDHEQPNKKRKLEDEDLKGQSQDVVSDTKENDMAVQPTKRPPRSKSLGPAAKDSNPESSSDLPLKPKANQALPRSRKMATRTILVVDLADYPDGDAKKFALWLAYKLHSFIANPSRTKVILAWNEHHERSLAATYQDFDTIFQQVPKVNYPADTDSITIDPQNYALFDPSFSTYFLNGRWRAKSDISWDARVAGSLICDVLASLGEKKTTLKNRKDVELLVKQIEDENSAPLIEAMDFLSLDREVKRCLKRLFVNLEMPVNLDQIKQKASVNLEKALRRFDEQKLAPIESEKKDTKLPLLRARKSLDRIDDMVTARSNQSCDITGGVIGLANGLRQSENDPQRKLGTAHGGNLPASGAPSARLEQPNLPSDQSTASSDTEHSSQKSSSDTIRVAPLDEPHSEVHDFSSSPAITAASPVNVTSSITSFESPGDTGSGELADASSKQSRQPRHATKTLAPHTEPFSRPRINYTDPSSPRSSKRVRKPTEKILEAAEIDSTIRSPIRPLSTRRSSQDVVNDSPSKRSLIVTLHVKVPEESMDLGLYNNLPVSERKLVDNLLSFCNEAVLGLALDSEDEDDLQ